jgi:hypothetical protein
MKGIAAELGLAGMDQDRVIARDRMIGELNIPKPTTEEYWLSI